MPLPTLHRLLLDHHEYPGQPLISAACIVQLYDNPEAAAAPCLNREGVSFGFCDAEGNNEVPGAGGQATKAARALMAFREHGSIDQVIEDLHAGWRRTISPGNFEERYEPGMEKARAVEPTLREALAEWFAG